MPPKHGAPGATDSLQAAPPLSGRRARPLLWLALVVAILAAAAAVVLLRRGRGAIPDLAGASITWKDAKPKEILADYLNAQVKVPGFEVLVHKVARRENYWGLARSRHVDIDTVIGFNPDMEKLESYEGRSLLLPDQVGTLHQVQPGDTPASIEKDYSLAPGTVAAANRLGWDGLRPGQVLFLPKGRPRQYTPQMKDLYEGRDFIHSPLAGRFTSFVGIRIDPFTGAKHEHNGVDIAAPFNTLVAAAAAGKVVLAGWNDGFGKCVIIDHDRGYRTLYGHLNVILVHQGERVRQFQYIGRVGMTGWTTGPHLHFTIWKNGKLQNPLKYLW